MSERCPCGICVERRRAEKAEDALKAALDREKRLRGLLLRALDFAELSEPFEREIRAALSSPAEPDRGTG